VGYVVKMRICPEESVAEVIDCQRIRPGNPIFPVEESSEVRSVQAHPANVALQMPSGEEEVAFSRVHHNSSWVGDSRAQSFALGSVQLTDVQMARVPVQPVNLATHPVNGQTFQAVAIMPNNWLFGPSAINASSEIIFLFRFE